MADLLRCRFCSWTTPKWRTTKEGKKVSGWVRLKDHLWEEHTDQAAAIEEAAGTEGDDVDLLED